MNMLTFLMTVTSNLPTKQKFGEIMHDGTTSEEEKERILASVKEAGGYDNLED